jgi:thiamine-phosphate pyrophosphorylase
MSDQSEKMSDVPRFNLPKLYPITDTFLSGQSHADQVAALCAGGARLIQLREKRLRAEAFYEQARDAIRVARKHAAKIVINDRVDIAIAVGADGVHLGQDDLPVAAVRALLGETAIIGYSTHNLKQAKAANKFQIDYLAIGPIFATHTKSNPDPVVGLEGLKEVRGAIRQIPIVAIGGITPLNAFETLSAGANSVAVINYLVGKPDDIEERTREFLARIP